MTENKRPITVEDLKSIVYIEDPQISPDQQWIAYVHVKPEASGKRYARNIWVTSTDGATQYQLTWSGKDSQPRWSHDGKQIAFVSSRDDKPQVYLLPTKFPGGEARQLTQALNGANSPAWSPDDSQIAYLAGMNADEREKEDSGEKEEPPKDEMEGKHRKERKEQDETERWDPRPMWRIPYRQGTSFLDDRYEQVYVISTSNSQEDDKPEPKRLTNVDAVHEPPQWSPDGKYLFTSRTTDPERDEPWEIHNLYQIEVATGESTQFVDPENSVLIPRPSHDGKKLACVRSKVGSTDTFLKFSILDLEDHSFTDLNTEFDQQIADFKWTNDGELIVTSTSWGVAEIYQCNPADKSFNKLISGTMMTTAFDICDEGIAYAASTPLNPGELFWQPMAEIENPSAKQLTHVNQSLLDEIIVQATTEIRYQSPSGVEIQGWYLLPTDYEEGKQYPLALNIHGGPHVMWSSAERSMWHEWQLHAASGYVVFYCNPRGGDGYGENFMSAIHSNWGDTAMDDVMAGVEQVLQLGVVDEERMAITGGSYGGYMTGWIIGHTDRFRAAVSQRGVYNLVSFYGTSDVPRLISAEFDAEPWEDPAKLWEHSPLAYAHNVTTPLLLIHSENDFRVPIEQSEQFFAYVRRATDTPVKMIRYPREGHELSRSGEPNHRVSRLKEMVEWFDEYCK